MTAPIKIGDRVSVPHVGKSGVVIGATGTKVIVAYDQGGTGSRDERDCRKEGGK